MERVWFFWCVEECNPAWPKEVEKEVVGLCLILHQWFESRRRTAAEAYAFILKEFQHYLSLWFWWSVWCLHFKSCLFLFLRRTLSRVQPLSLDGGSKQATGACWLQHFITVPLNNRPCLECRMYEGDEVRKKKKWNVSFWAFTLTQFARIYTSDEQCKSSNVRLWHAVDYFTPSAQKWLTEGGSMVQS